MSPRNADRHEPDAPDIVQATRARREELGLSVSQMSERAGVSMQTWRNYEAGRSRVRADKRDSVWDALGWELPSPWSAQRGVVVGELGELGAPVPLVRAQGHDGDQAGRVGAAAPAEQVRAEQARSGAARSDRRDGRRGLRHRRRHRGRRQSASEPLRPPQRTRAGGRRGPPHPRLG